MKETQKDGHQSTNKKSLALLINPDCKPAKEKLKEAIALKRKNG